MSETELRQHRCCFTGHREQKLRRGAGLIRRELEKEIRKAVSEGFTTFITGMAYGVDIMAGEIVVNLKKEFPAIKLIAAVPFPGFESRWGEEWKNRYQILFQQADLVRFICDSYASSAYQKRNEWMVEQAQLLLCCVEKQSGGAYTAMKYAERLGKEIINLATPITETF